MASPINREQKPILLVPIQAHQKKSRWNYLGISRYAALFSPILTQRNPGFRHDFIAARKYAWQEKFTAKWIYKHEGKYMFRWVLFFFIVAIIAGFFGFSGIAHASAQIAKIIFVIFLILFAISIILSLFKWF